LNKLRSSETKGCTLQP